MNEEKFWIVLVEGTSGSICREHIHITRVDAAAEAERLACLNKGRKIYICEAVNYCWMPETPIQWRVLS